MTSLFAPGASKSYATSSSSVLDKKLVVLVGGSQAWFQDLERAVLELRPNWSLEHVSSKAALKNRLASNPPDTIIAHPKLEGTADLFAEVARRFAFISPISLADELNHSGIDGGSDPSAEKIHPDESAEKVVCAILLREWMSQPSVKSLMAQIKTLPTLPKLHFQITRELRSPNGSIEMVSQYVRKDPVMAAKFLQVVNSASFGLAYTVQDPAEAVMFLGVERTRALVLAAGVFSQFDELRCSGVSPEQIWKHSLQVASLAQGVVLLHTEDPMLAETAFTAGLLHDIGKLILAGNAPEMYATAHRLQQSKKIEEADAEKTILSANHAEFGACMLASWRLPLRIVEAVAWHHKPSLSFDRAFSILTAVHAGNVLAHEMNGADDDIAQPSRFDIFYLAKLGLATHRNSWREGCGLPIKDEQDSYEAQLRRQIESGCK